MKEILTKTDKSKILLTLIFRVLIYVCWYIFAILFIFHINENVNRTKIFYLILSLIIVYTIRNILKYLYNKNSNSSYHNLKHNIELYYFKKLRYLKAKDILSIDRKYVANKILDLSYNFTKIVSDIGEYIIPSILGCILLVIASFKINLFLGIFVVFALCSLLYLRYLYILKNEEESVNNYNDLLKDYVIKLDTIRKLNIFDYCVEKLNDNKDNDICFLKNKDINNDLFFNNGICILVSIIFIAIIFFVENSITSLGYILFFIVLMLKLKNVLYEINPSINNIFLAIKNRKILNSYFTDLEEYIYVKSWKKINIKEGVCTYSDPKVAINIPDFELINGDQVSIMGKSGEGKSTVLNILSGMAKLDKGSLLFDNKTDKTAINAVYISKNVELFNMSLRDNLTLGKKVNDIELLDMLKSLGLLTWYSELTDGFDTIIDNHYIKLNLSILQRLNLIRAIILDKDVYFLDEPTYDMDIDTEKLVAAFIKKHLKKKTFIIVTHRPLLTTICKKHYFMKDHTILDKEPLL